MQADRKLLLVGIRLLGLILVAHAVVKFACSSYSAGVKFYMLSKVEQSADAHRRNSEKSITPAQNTQDAKQRELEAQLREMENKRRIEQEYQAVMFRTSFYSDLCNAGMALLAFAIGLYMCRRGELLLRFLKATEVEEPSAPLG